MVVVDGERKSSRRVFIIVERSMCCAVNEGGGVTCANDEAGA